MAKKWNPDSNGLWSWQRHPDGIKSFSNNPPRSVDEAIERKTNMYVREDGSIRTLRAKSRAKTYKGLRFEDEDYESRKSNRGNPSKRGQAEELVTPDKATRQAANRQMARTAAKGRVGHHGLPISYLAAGEREKPGTVAAYKKVHGKGKVGHSPGALVEMSIPEHQYLHNKLEPAYERAIKKAGSQTDEIFNSLRKSVTSKNLGYAGMLIGPAVVLATGGSPAEAAGSFIDSMPGIGDITADNTAPGALNEPQRVEEAYAQLERQRQAVFNFVSGIPSRMRGFPVLP